MKEKGVGAAGSGSKILPACGYSFWVSLKRTFWTLCSLSCCIFLNLVMELPNRLESEKCLSSLRTSFGRILFLGKDSIFSLCSCFPRELQSFRTVFLLPFLFFNPSAIRFSPAQHRWWPRFLPDRLHSTLQYFAVQPPLHVKGKFVPHRRQPSQSSGCFPSAFAFMFF
jgi:hypothetical protein